MAIRLYFLRFPLNVVSFLVCFSIIFVCSQILDNVTRMGLRVTSCGDDMLQFRRCLAASFFLNAALKQPDGVYRYSSALTKVLLLLMFASNL